MEREKVCGGRVGRVERVGTGYKPVPRVGVEGEGAGRAFVHWGDEWEC